MPDSAPQITPTPSDDLQSLSGTLRAALDSIGLSPTTIGVGILSAAALFSSGCSPQSKSYWSGTYTPLPDPPASCRLVLNTSTEDDGTIFINYVEWDTKTDSFVRRDTHYSTKGVVGNWGDFKEYGGYEQKIRDGEVLVNGAIVDQAGKKIDIGNGRFVDGPTGNILDAKGNILKELKK